MKKNRLIAMLFSVLLAGLVFSACGKESESGETKQSFLQIGEFTVERVSDQRINVRDGAGRTLVLVPRWAPAPADVDPVRLVRTPVKRVAAYGFFDIATLRAWACWKRSWWA